jgi:hypothetical protein
MEFRSAAHRHADAIAAKARELRGDKRHGFFADATTSKKVVFVGISGPNGDCCVAVDKSEWSGLETFTRFAEALA